MTRHAAASYQGFSLIELLTAVTIAVMLIGLVTMITRDSESAWTTGVQRAERDANARAAIQMISRDLRYALADNHLVFTLKTDTNAPSYAFFPNTQARFFTLRPDEPGSTRTVSAIAYEVRPTTNALGLTYTLWRGEQTLPATNQPNNFYAGVTPDPMSHAAGPVALNVASFALIAAPDAIDYGPSNQLPAHLDLWLELLDDRSARRAARITNTLEQANIVERQARRYTTRIYMGHRYAAE